LKLKEERMELLIVVIDTGALIAAVMLGMIAAYFLQRGIHGTRVYYAFRGSRLVTCPETRQRAVVELDAKSMGMQAILGSPRLRLQACSRWPMREGCGQECLRQIEARPAELKFIAACGA
jgi:hypothetical protein